MGTEDFEPQGSIRYFAGALSGLAAVSIWAGWMSVTRLGVTTSLAPSDLTVLRFGTAGILLLPVILRRGFGLDRLSLLQLVILVSGAGAPYALVAASGLRFASAGQAGVLIPGIMPLFVAALAAVFFHERFTRSRKLGFGLMVCGLVAVVAPALLQGTGTPSLGHGLFLSASLMWACYTLVLRRSGLSPLHAAAIVSVGSALGYAPVYFFLTPGNLFQAPASDLVVQALFQGVLATILSLYFFGRAVALLGATAGASFGALVPGLAALFAVPLLGEVPKPFDLLAIATTTIGVYLASGGRFHARSLGVPT